MMLESSLYAGEPSQGRAVANVVSLTVVVKGTTHASRHVATLPGTGLSFPSRGLITRLFTHTMIGSLKH
jgi:hypothetical protein